MKWNGVVMKKGIARASYSILAQFFKQVSIELQ